MNSFAFVVLCFHAVVAQNAVAQCNSPPLYNRPLGYPHQAPIRPPCGPLPPSPCNGPIPPCNGPVPPCNAPVLPCNGPVLPCNGPVARAIPPVPALPGSGPALACAGPALPGSAPAPHHITLPNGCSFTINGDNLLIDGTVEICGSIPFVSHVQLDGNLPVDGSASVQSNCYCGNGYGY